MYKKVYLSRATTRSMAADHPIGDPFGGPAYGEYNDPVSAAIVGGAGLVGSFMQGNAAQNAAQTQADAGRAAQAQLMAAGKEASGQFTPYTDIGKTALSSLASQMPYFNKQFGNEDLNANIAPNYAFGLDVGQRSNLMASNAAGGAVGGNAQTALNQFSQNYAQNAYQNAFNNFQAQRTNIFNTNNALAGMGLTGATGAANAIIGTGTNVAGVTQGIGNAQAAGQIGAANAYGGGITNAGNLYALSSLISKPTTPTGGGSLDSLGLQYG